MIFKLPNLELHKKLHVEKKRRKKLKCPCCLQMTGSSQMQQMFNIKLHERDTIRNIDFEKLKN